MVNEIDFEKYRTRGAYHWEQVSRSIRRHNAFVSARYNAVVAALGDVHGKRILDIGGGDGVLSYLLAEKGATTITLDPVLLALKFSQQSFASRGYQARPTAASAYELPFAADVFEAAVCSEVIEHVQSPQKLLAEAARILQPGGQLILTTPLRITEVPVDPMHVHEFFQEELESLVAANFEKVSTTVFMPLALLELFGLSFPWLGGRPLFRYIFNAMAIYLKWNPFDIKTTFRYFSMIIVIAQKKQ